MCDTIGRIIDKNYAIFGKNSDRAVNEPQVVEYYKAEDHKGGMLKCTYITIPQANHTNAIVLSRPSWIWGGEIGVNEYGVCIGNEAVFTKGKYSKYGLIGMDLLRLGLERGDSAYNAMMVIIKLLEKYGQGGNCGYDSDFRYNNSFLIMDRKEIYVLETKDKEYVYKKYDHTSISNYLSIRDNGDVYSGERIDFQKKYSDFIMTTGSKGKKRRGSSLNHKLDGLEDMMDILRSHTEDNVLGKGSVGSVCMHAANPLTADQTTASMIVELKKNDITIWITGSSLPCLSLYKPHHFTAEGLISEGIGNSSYWYRHEAFNRRFINANVPQSYYDDLYFTQNKIIELGKKYNKRILKIDEDFFNYHSKENLEYGKGNIIYNSFWKKKNAVFEKEMEYSSI